MSASTFLVAADLHGWVPGAESLVQLVARRRPALVVLLGDLFHHGAFRPGFDARKAAAIVAQLPAPVAVVAGNCDSSEDLEELPWACAGQAWLHFGELFLAVHGHQLTASGDWPDGGVPNLLSAHTHVPRAEKGPRGRRWNPGSLGAPKRGYPPTYGWYQDGRFSVTALDGEIIAEDVLD
jgi:predicted phosphodiesterase